MQAMRKYANQAVETTVVAAGLPPVAESLTAGLGAPVASIAGPVAGLGLTFAGLGMMMELL